MPRPRSRRDGEPFYPMVDSTGLKLCGAGEWLVEKHGAKMRRSRRKQHIGLDAGTEIGALLDQVTGPMASFTADGAYDPDGVSTAVAERHPEAAIIAPPHGTAVPSETAQTKPAQLDRHLQHIAEHGRATWQKISGIRNEPGLRRPSAGSIR